MRLVNGHEVGYEVSIWVGHGADNGVCHKVGRGGDHGVRHVVGHVVGRGFIRRVGSGVSHFQLSLIKCLNGLEILIYL